jgi:hypothetical protein
MVIFLGKKIWLHMFSANIFQRAEQYYLSQRPEIYPRGILKMDEGGDSRNIRIFLVGVALILGIAALALLLFLWWKRRDAKRLAT